MQINSIKNERDDLSTDSQDIKRIIKEYYKQLYANKCSNLNEIHKLFERYKIPKPMQEKKINDLDSSIFIKEIQVVV